MINVRILTVALFDQLVADSYLSMEGCTIERSTRVNFDPARCPWVGVYPGTVNTVGRAMGGRSWTSDAELQVVIQQASLSGDGTAASDALEDTIKAVLDVVNSDLFLGVTGARVVGISREYRYIVFDDDGSGDLFMPQAIVKLKLEVRS